MKHITKYILLAFFILPVMGVCQKSNTAYSHFTGGKIHVVPSSHQDIAWMDTPDKCMEFRDKYMITPALARLKENKEFCFSVENALNLYEYLEKHPDRIDDIIKYTSEGRLEWGATYNQPYEGLYEGEALIREVYYGKKKLQRIIPNGKFTCAWSEDVPGRSLQIPQIFSKAGIPYLQFSRFQPGLYKWYSPDGSYITCWTPGQYEESGREIRNAKTEKERTQGFIKKIANWNDYYKQRSLSPDFIYISSQDFSQPLNYDNYFEAWNTRINNKQSDFPFINYSTGTEAVKAASKGVGKIDSIMGENPNLWLYIHGPTHEKAIKNARLSSKVLTAAEKFSAIAAVLRGDFKDYPQNNFDDAWQHAIYPDHGWGGVHGDITDKIFANSYEKAVATGNSILQEKLNFIASKIKFKATGIPIVVFNSLSWKRTDPVQVTVNTEGIYSSDFQLVNDRGEQTDYQIISSPLISSDSHITLSFIAIDVPSIGYTTYYLLPGKAGVDEKLSINITKNIVDTRFYKIELGKGGIKSIYDKELQRELINPEKFLAGEMFSMQSVGNGAGEFTDIQQPTMEGFEKMSQYAPDWVLLENGAVRTIFEAVHPWRNCTVKQRVIFYTMIKRIDFEAEIIGFNGEKSREFRLAFPLNMDSAKVCYEVPMGVVEVGKTELPMAPGFSKPEQVYSTPCKDVHPREVQDWFGASDKKASVTISSDVSVFDWIDPTGQILSQPLLQPLLLASRRSCNESELANWYLQRGNHSFRFSFFSNSGAWKSGWKNGKQAAQPLMVLENVQKSAASSLPERFSFAGVDKENVIISTIKKNDEQDKIILRCYDTEGKNTEVLIDWFKGIRLLEKTNIIEQYPENIPLKDNKSKVAIGKYSIETFQFAPGFDSK